MKLNLVFASVVTSIMAARQSSQNIQVPNDQGQLLQCRIVDEPSVGAEIPAQTVLQTSTAQSIPTSVPSSDQRPVITGDDQRSGPSPPPNEPKTPGQSAPAISSTPDGGMVITNGELVITVEQGAGKGNQPKAKNRNAPKQPNVIVIPPVGDGQQAPTGNIPTETTTTLTGASPNPTIDGASNSTLTLTTTDGPSATIGTSEPQIPGTTISVNGTSIPATAGDVPVGTITTTTTTSTAPINRETQVGNQGEQRTGNPDVPQLPNSAPQQAPKGNNRQGKAKNRAAKNRNRIVNQQNIVTMYDGQGEQRVAMTVAMTITAEATDAANLEKRQVMYLECDPNPVQTSPATTTNDGQTKSLPTGSSGQTVPQNEPLPQSVPSDQTQNLPANEPATPQDAPVIPGIPDQQQSPPPKGDPTTGSIDPNATYLKAETESYGDINTSSETTTSFSTALKANSLLLLTIIAVI